MPRFRSDSDASDDYSSRRQRSPTRRRSSTPGPGRLRDPFPDTDPRLQYEPYIPFHPPPPVASGAAGPGPGPGPSRLPRSSAGDTFTTGTAGTTSTTADADASTDPTTMARRRSSAQYARDRYRPSSRASDDSLYDTDDEDANVNYADETRSRGNLYPSPPQRPPSPLSKARALLAQTFTPSTSGLGAGVLGAIVGGLAAGEVAQHSHHNNSGRRGRGGGGGGAGSKGHDRQVLLSTVVGAAVGGLGANALEKRIERARRERELERAGWQ